MPSLYCTIWYCNASCRNLTMYFTITLLIKHLQLILHSSQRKHYNLMCEVFWTIVHSHGWVSLSNSCTAQQNIRAQLVTYHMKGTTGHTKSCSSSTSSNQVPGLSWIHTWMQSILSSLSCMSISIFEVMSIYPIDQYQNPIARAMLLHELKKVQLQEHFMLMIMILLVIWKRSASFYRWEVALNLNGNVTAHHSALKKH